MSNCQYYINNPLSGNQYTYTSTTKIIPFPEKLVVRISPCNFLSWLTPCSWFLHTANIYQSPWQHFNNFIASTPHSTHISSSYPNIFVYVFASGSFTLTWQNGYYLQNTWNAIPNIHNFEANFYSWMSFLTQTFFAAK